MEVPQAMWPIEVSVYAYKQSEMSNNCTVKCVSPIGHRVECIRVQGQANVKSVFDCTIKYLPAPASTSSADTITDFARRQGNVIYHRIFM